MPKRTERDLEIDGHQIQLTNLDKRYWPDDRLTKGDAIDYYRHVAPVLLPYLRNRPVTLRSFPNGIAGPGFWRRDLPDNAPDWLAAASYQPESRRDRIEVPIVDNLASLVWYVDHAAIEIHQWMSRADDLEHPDFAVFDLDPGESVEFQQVLEVATLVRDRLQEDGIESFAKTSGATGMHVFIPIKRDHTYSIVRDWVHGMARRLEEQHPNLIASASGGTHRGERVTIDHAQNSIARNTAAPYTLRARPGAPVSMPVSWTAVQHGGIRPEHFTLSTVPQRIDHEGDAWQVALSLPQRLPVES